MIFLPMAISMVGAATVWRFVYDFQPEGHSPDRPAQRDPVGRSATTRCRGCRPARCHLNSLLLMVILLWSQVGYAMVLLSAAIKGVPVETLEAARIDGADERQIFFRVVVPQIKGTIITVVHHRARSW